ncbi:MAG: hypothetical protein E6G47_07100 [Actinobacteria bacterium]|nr:MAG: hypothetical protein E6G47_07100 [Actinomycetota bacterium]
MPTTVSSLRTARIEPITVKPPRQHEAGRRCRLCGTQLSRYNPSPIFCYAHEPPTHRIPARWD